MKAMATMKILDHGYVRLVETYGSDSSIIEAARMSTGKGFVGWGTPESKGDEKLLRYLWENKHATPFEMGGAIIEVKAPIFIFREWHRHRTQSYNEMSARYIPLPDENYIPTIERLMVNSKKNKQAGVIKGAAVLTVRGAEEYTDRLRTMYKMQQEFYEAALGQGVPKELARNHLPVGRYSRMRAAANLRNWLAFLTLRHHSAAQWEIQQYAIAVHEILAEYFPYTLELFDEGHKS